MTPDDFMEDARNLVNRGYNIGLIEAAAAALHAAYIKGREEERAERNTPFERTLPDGSPNPFHPANTIITGRLIEGKVSVTTAIPSTHEAAILSQPKDGE